MTVAVVSRRDLKAYPKPVVDTLLEGLKDNPDLKVRLMDSTHLRIFDGNRDNLPFKIAANRPAEDCLRYLRPWLAERAPEKEASVTNETPDPVAVPESTTNSETPGFTVVDGEYRCDHCTFSRPVDRGRVGLHLHAQTHNTEGHTARVEQAKRASETRALKAVERKEKARRALLDLIDVLGLDDLTDCKDEVETLRKENGDLRAKLDLLHETFKGLS